MSTYYQPYDAWCHQCFQLQVTSAAGVTWSRRCSAGGGGGGLWWWWFVVVVVVVDSSSTGAPLIHASPLNTWCRLSRVPLIHLRPYLPPSRSLNILGASIVYSFLWFPRPDPFEYPTLWSYYLSSLTWGGTWPWFIKYLCFSRLIWYLFYCCAPVCCHHMY